MLISDRLPFPELLEEFFQFSKPKPRYTEGWYVHINYTNNIQHLTNGKLYYFSYGEVGEWFYSGLLSQNDIKQPIMFSTNFLRDEEYKRLPFKIGDKVFHNKFGWGVLTQLLTSHIMSHSVMNFDSRTKYRVKFNQGVIDCDINLLSHTEYDFHSGGLTYFKDGHVDEEILNKIKTNYKSSCQNR